MPSASTSALRARARARLSDQQLKALELLAFAVPIHHTTLKWSGVRGPTLRSLANHKPALARLTFLREDDSRIGIPFWTATQAGEQLVGKRKPRVIS